ncbi:MAG: DNA ligase-associated DEXH box helicase, partial [Myxococcales bacterium]
PPSVHGSTWTRRFGEHSDAFASGWMQLRGARRRRAVDRGFALSDHADWPGLLRTVRETGAKQVFATHGHREALSRYLREQGVDAASIGTVQPSDPEGD